MTPQEISDPDEDDANYRAGWRDAIGYVVSNYEVHRKAPEPSRKDVLRPIDLFAGLIVLILAIGLAIGLADSIHHWLMT